MLKLRDYQERAKTHIVQNSHCALFLDMGLGKTIAALYAINELLDSILIRRVLIIAPLRVCDTVWKQEAKKWNLPLSFSIATGAEKDRKSALESYADVTLLNVDNVEKSIDYFSRFDMLVIDESSMFKNHAAKRFKALKKIRHVFKRIVLLTGTPSPNGFMDLWSQIYLLDAGNRLEPTITAYRKKYFESDFMGYAWDIREGQDKIITSKIKDLALSMESKDYLELPDAIEIVRSVELSKTDYEQYKDLEKDFYIELNNTDVTALSAGVLSNKLLQFCNGAIYDDAGGFIDIHFNKLKELQTILDENPNDNILVAYNYQFDKLRLLKYIDCAQELDIDRWNAGKQRLAIAHPASCGHGLNLQEGGSILVWFGLNWSLELVQQMNKRLHRSGQKNIVKIIYLSVCGAIDEKVFTRIKEKATTQQQLIEALK